MKNKLRAFDVEIKFTLLNTNDGFCYIKEYIEKMRNTELYNLFYGMSDGQVRHIGETKITVINEGDVYICPWCEELIETSVYVYDEVDEEVYHTKCYQEYEEADD